jgi:hypothetical protein
MELREEILKEHSKKQSEKIKAWVGADKGRFATLLHLFLHDEYRVVQRAAWILSMIAETHPELIRPHLKKLVTRMNDEGVHVAVKRNVVRLLQYFDIPKQLHSEVINTCFSMLADPKETVAVRCFSMTVLDNLSKTYPEIRQELRLVINDILEHDPTAGLIARAKQVLKSKP